MQACSWWGLQVVRKPPFHTHKKKNSVCKHQNGTSLRCCASTAAIQASRYLVDPCRGHCKPLHTRITKAIFSFGAWHRPCPQFRGKRVRFSVTFSKLRLSALVSTFSCPPSCPEIGQQSNRLSLSPLLKLQTSHNLSRR